jgi:hypothetical protein
MTATKVRQTVISEIQSLPDDQLPGVLEYIRFLRIKLLSDQELEDRFDVALASARAIAKREGITQEDVEREIEIVRSGE